MTNEQCDILEFVNFTFMTDTNNKFVNAFLIYAKTKFKEFGKKMDLYNVWEIMHFEFLMDTQAQLINEIWTSASTQNKMSSISHIETKLCDVVRMD